MKIPKSCEDYFKLLKKGESETLKDARTTLYLKAGETVYIVKVDGGIVKNSRQGIKKSDYLIYGEDEKGNTHLIERKGADVEEAFIQLKTTIADIDDLPELSFLIRKRLRLTRKSLRKRW